MDKAKVLKILKDIINVLNGKIGDTDPNVDDMTEAEIIEYEPNYWLIHRVLEIEQEIKQQPCEKCAPYEDSSIIANFCYNCGRALTG